MVRAVRHEEHLNLHPSGFRGRLWHPRQAPGGSGTYSRRVECSCCGEVREASMVSSLQCHDEIKICRICAQWLVGRTGGIDVTPTLPVADMAKTIEFWEAAGFEVNRYDDGFAFVSFDEKSVSDLDRGHALGYARVRCHQSEWQPSPDRALNTRWRGGIGRLAQRGYRGRVVPGLT